MIDVFSRFSRAKIISDKRPETINRWEFDKDNFLSMAENFGS